MEIHIMAAVDLQEIQSEDGFVTCYVTPTDLYKAKDAIEEAKGETKFEVMEIKMLPQEYVTLNEEDAALFKRLLDLLDEVDDVQQVFHNVEGM